MFQRLGAPADVNGFGEARILPVEDPTRFATRYFGGDAGQPARQHDVAADGPQFLLIKDSSESRTAGSNLTIVLNWFDELKRVATVK